MTLQEELRRIAQAALEGCSDREFELDDLHEVMDVAKRAADALDATALDEPEIFANCRGFLGDGRPLDGGLDGWSWHAWSGSLIAYGSSEEHAKENLRRKRREITETEAER